MQVEGDQSALLSASETYLFANTFLKTPVAGDYVLRFKSTLKKLEIPFSIVPGA